MKENKDIPEIRDDEIRVIGDSQSGENKNGRAWWWILAAVVLAAGIVSAVLLVREPGNAADRDEQEQDAYNNQQYPHGEQATHFFTAILCVLL